MKSADQDLRAALERELARFDGQTTPGVKEEISGVLERWRLAAINLHLAVTRFNFKSPRIHEAIGEARATLDALTKIMTEIEIEDVPRPNG